MTDLGDVLHLVGGTAAAFMIFFLPGLLLINAAIIKESASTADLAAMEVCCVPADSRACSAQLATWLDKRFATMHISSWLSIPCVLLPKGHRSADRTSRAASQLGSC